MNTLYYIVDSKQHGYTAEELEAYLSASLGKVDLADKRIIRGGPLSPVPQPTFDLRAVGQGQATTREKRDKDADEAMYESVGDWLEKHPGPHAIKVIAAGVGVTTAEVSRAKQALLKSGAATDPGKGKLAAKF